MKYWLITWEGGGENAHIENEVIAILDCRVSSERVREMIEWYYLNEKGSLAQRIAYAKNKRLAPYKAQYGSVGDVEYLYQLVCGHNPYIHARLVTNVEVVINENGDEKLIWQDVPKPKYNPEWTKGR